jgi:DNA-binding NtrC family response regulator
MPSRHTLLWIVEMGGYPDFTPIYRQAGFEVSTAVSVRKALTMIKKSCPQVIVTEFVFLPTYGSRISTLESLVAGVQRDCPECKLIVFLEKDNAHHLDKIQQRFAFFDTLFFPIKEDVLQQAIDRAAHALESAK